jgi:predicted nucleic acid-binding protein
MMTKSLERYTDIKEHDFSKASIYLDACFIIKSLDQNSSALKTKVISLLEKWADSDDINILLSPYTASEVIHIILKNLIYRAIELENKKVNGTDMNILEQTYYRMIPATSLLYSCVDKNALKQIIESPDNSYINVTKLLKDVKSKCSPSELQSLNFYYHQAVNTFLTHLSGWKRLGLKNIHIINLNEDVYNTALMYIQAFLLETNDAFHLASTENFKKTNPGTETYFVTLDKDFTTSMFKTASDLSARIIRIA